MEQFVWVSVKQGRPGGSDKKGKKRGNWALLKIVAMEHNF